MAKYEMLLCLVERSNDVHHNRMMKHSRPTAKGHGEVIEMMHRALLHSNAKNVLNELLRLVQNFSQTIKFGDCQPD